VIPDPRDILLAPVVSEKSYGLLGVKVLSVNTLNRSGKRKRSRTGYGKRKDTKRAIVTLSQESATIDVFGGRAS
jgi:large subunit ribosomal protein L23